jgi:peptidyl-prolyl cis-trans isomerase SurA
MGQKVNSVNARLASAARSFVVAAACALASAAGAEAQTVQRIAAIVNDEVISAYDLQTRMKLVLFSTRLADTPEVRQRIAPQVLRTLIDERLQLQEAEKRNISVTEQDIAKAFELIEQDNKLPKGKLEGLLAENGVTRDTMVSQIRANVAWSKLLGRRIRPRINIGDDEVDETLARIRSRQGQTEYRLGEIVLPVDSPDDETNVQRTAERIADQVTQGARFEAIARQFSQSPTAAVGGDLGWVHEAELEPALREAISKMSVGAITAPIKTVTGYRLILLQAERKIAHGAATEVSVDLQQVYLPLPPQPATADIEAQTDLAKTLQSSASGCQDFRKLAAEVGSPNPPELGKFKLTNLSSQIRAAVQELPVGKVSDPVKMPEGILLLMVCSREGGKTEAKLPERDEIADQLFQERMSLMSRRYLRDIRLSAVVDIRI